jgi:phage major head subunit gpT-like protein
MDITPAALATYFKTLSFAFASGMASAPTYWAQVATEIPSSGEGNIYPFLATIPGLREWVGPRVVNNVSLRNYVLTNKWWEDTVGIDRQKLEDDQYGFFAPLIGMLGMQVQEWRDRELARVIEAGTTDLCWDGQFFFDTDHPIDPDGLVSGTNSNKLVGAAYDIAGNSGDPLVAYANVKALMATWKREDNRNMATIPNLLMVHPAQEKQGKQIKNALITMANGTGSAGVSNVFQGDVDLIINPYLTVTSGNPWYLMKTNMPLKPFIWQDRKAAELVSRTALTDDNVYRARQFEWGVDLRGAAGYSFPFLAFRGSLS